MKLRICFLMLMFVVFINQINYGQNAVPTIKAKSTIASVRIGDMFFKNAWQMSANSEKEPEAFNSPVDKKGTLIAIITDIDSIGFNIKQGESRIFRIIINQKDTVWGKMRGGYPKANFTEGYKKTYDGKTLIEIPPFYELVNIVMAITPTGINDSNLIEHTSPYFSKVQTAFNKFKNHKAVATMDSLLKKDMYHEVKMDAYNFEFNLKGGVYKKAAYNRISWGTDNTIEPYVSLLVDFAKKSNFQKFYQSNKPYYASLIRAYRDSLGVPAMQKWLNTNFPKTRYNCFKIIFSPLVNGNQSSTEFSSNGFNEGQPHVNFPNYWHNPKSSNVSEKAINIKRGDIVFTELNHLFENPEFEKETNWEAFNNIPYKLSVFARPNTPAATYDTPLRCTEEYMNWGLVSLRYIDTAPKADLEGLFLKIENNMVNNRGFIKFKEFNRFLIDIYQKRPQGQVVADLYPQIIEWFKVNNQ